MLEKTVVVTGATGLLGRQCVKAFEGAGWNTVGTGEFLVVAGSFAWVGWCRALMGGWWAGFSRANPPAISKVDLGNAGEVVRLLEEVKYVLFSQL